MRGDLYEKECNHHRFGNQRPYGRQPLDSRRGIKVTIFEAHNMPGGYTAGFYRKGYYFESGTLSFEASASVFKAMKDIGVFEKINFVRQKMRFVSEEFDGIPQS